MIHTAASRASTVVPLSDAARRACARIAPTWPLDRFIAVNPFWELVDAPLRDVAARLRSLSGAQLLMPRAWYRAAYREGKFGDAHLRAALEEAGSTRPLASLLALLDEDEPTGAVRARVVDVVDASRDLGREPSWSGFVTHSVSQFCAAYFDADQASFRPARDGGLYQSWRRLALDDRSPRLLMGAKGFRDQAAQLAPTAAELVRTALADLDVAPAEHESYLWSLLLEQNGWASWCAYRRWVASLDGREDEALGELLAIRLAWEWLLFRLGGAPTARRWALAMAAWPRADAEAAVARTEDWLFQAALEIAHREPIIRAFPSGLREARPAAVAAQAVFCIDVRSETFRRALEEVTPGVQTLGFAGFFGLPIDYRPLGAPEARPQLPGLVRPRLRAEDVGVDVGAAHARAHHHARAAAWRSFKTDALSTFTFVDALGVTYASDLFRASLGLGSAPDVDAEGLGAASNAQRRPRLSTDLNGQPLTLEARGELAASMLRGMSLTRDFAPIVLLVGHGSTSRNNPHAAGLDCGACCGQTGEVNARVAAALLNDPQVRDQLAQRGITVPEGTRFIAGLHGTTGDEVELFELDALPSAARAEVERLRAWLAAAGARTRAERAKLLGLEQVPAGERDAAVRGRARDWAQVRPEWGLVNNAAFIVAPREHCRHLDLGGRSFLHEYRHWEDEGFAVLETIMTAPMVVTHWINFQYYASTVDHQRYGSGNKVLHNVVGSHLGVFEGNGGDLRIGLPLQSLHDGRRWVHTPQRLSVFIEAPRSAIDRVLQKHDRVRSLAANGWLSLFQLDADEGAVYALQGGQWQRQSTGDRTAPAAT